MMGSMADSPLPLGYNTYSLRALRWSDRSLLEYAREHWLDAIFLQDSPDPRSMDPEHWKEVRAWAGELGLHLETGGGGILPKRAEDIPQSIATLRRHIERAAAMGSPFVRCVLAADRASLPAPVEQSMEWAVKILRAVRPELSGRGLKAIIEVHKDLQAWELREVVEAAGKDLVGVYYDTGNPVFVLEHPMTTLETLAPYIESAHLRDSVIYEHPRGVAVQWVPLGEGAVDFRAIVQRLAELCPRVHVYNKPITGRPPAVIPYLEQDYWKMFPRARAGDLAKFLDLARQGRPYEGRMTMEPAPGEKAPDGLHMVLQFQQLNHLEKGLRYAKDVLGLGRRWRGAA